LTNRFVKVAPYGMNYFLLLLTGREESNGRELACALIPGPVMVYLPSAAGLGISWACAGTRPAKKMVNNTTVRKPMVVDEDAMAEGRDPAGPTKNWRDTLLFIGL